MERETYATKILHIPFKKTFITFAKFMQLFPLCFWGSPKQFQYIGIFKLLTLPLHEAANIVVAIILTKATVFIYEDIKLTICTYNINILSKTPITSNIAPQK